MTKISTILRRLMYYYGLTQDEFAAKFNFDKSQVSRWLNNKSTPRGDVFMRLQEEYDKIEKAEPILFE